MKLLEKIGQRIKIIRINSGYKQKDLATILNIPPTLLSMYEKGRREPSISFIERLCSHFDMSLSQFFTFQELSHNKLSDEESNILTTLNSLFQKLEVEKFKSNSY